VFNSNNDSGISCDGVTYVLPNSFLCLILLFACSVLFGCTNSADTSTVNVRISVVNPPADIVTVGAQYIAEQIELKSNNMIRAKVYHSGVLSGGRGETEIEMCQQGTLQMHVTSTAYLANLVPKTSVVSLPFLFRDIDQVVALVKSKSKALQVINSELNTKNLHVIAWWPRGFRQLTNSKVLVKRQGDMKGMKLRVMNNPLYADNMKSLRANPVPMAWGEVYNALQLKTIDGQENAEDVIYRSKLFEAQKFMTIWDYSVDFEVVLVNVDWWKNLPPEHRTLVQDVAEASIAVEEELLRNNTILLRKKIADEGMEIHYLSATDKAEFRQAVQPVWEKYERIFGESFLDAFMKELENY
jgi:tripartite ATP-independent transporter DctP family solute receptor